MSLETVLADRRKEILRKWEEVVLDRYEAESVRIFKNQKDPFANPLGHKTSAGLEELYEVVCDESDVEIETPALGQLIKLMAVQNIAPSQALGFVFSLKVIVRKVAGKKEISSREWESLDARVDRAALALFDIYNACREQLHRVRFNDLQKQRNALTSEAVCPSAFMNDE